MNLSDPEPNVDPSHLSVSEEEEEEEIVTIGAKILVGEDGEGGSVLERGGIKSSSVNNDGKSFEIDRGD